LSALNHLTVPLLILLSLHNGELLPLFRIRIHRFEAGESKHFCRKYLGQSRIIRHTRTRVAPL
jgi:hypothetical protein